MKIHDLFIGRWVYWLLAGGVFAILAVLGLNQEHVRDFVPFQFTVLGLAAFIVASVLYLYKPGERITREPLDDQDNSRS